MHNNDTVQSLETRLRAQMDILDEALMKIRGRELVSLQSMENDVTAICNAIEAAAPETAQAMGPLMAEMVGKLEEMATELKDFQDYMGKQQYESPPPGQGEG